MFPSPLDSSVPTLTKVLRRFFPAFLRARIRKLMFRSLGLAWTLPSGLLFRLTNYGEWVVYNEIFTNGEYDPAIDQALQTRSLDALFYVLDLGANVGFFTIRVVDRARQQTKGCTAFTILAIEGNARSVQEFNSRVRVENHLHEQVQVVHGLVGERVGSATLYDALMPSQNSLFQQREGGVTVDYVDLDKLTAEAPAVDLLKCDIEGAELLFLRNYPGLLRKVRIAIFEFHSAFCDVEQCRRLLREYGFTRHVVLRDEKGLSIEWAWREKKKETWESKASEPRSNDTFS